jgi:hypothetical protein
MGLRFESRKVNFKADESVYLMFEQLLQTLFRILVGGRVLGVFLQM